MINDYLKKVDLWPYPVPHFAEHAQVWHTRRFIAWLLRAGAEARFGTLLNSGTQAQARWTLLLEEQGIEVLRVVSHLERPLPKVLTEHRGDHFNRRLFLLDGLDEISAAGSEEDRINFWATLDGQRSQIKQMATWVILNITQAKTLQDALLYAPRLMKSLDRACWVWSSSERSKSEPLFHIEHEKHSLIFNCFAQASAFQKISNHQSLSRIFRCGYMKPSPKVNQLWRWGYQLWRGEVRDPTAARFGQHGVTEPLADTISPSDALWALKSRYEAATPARIEQWRKRAIGSRQAWQIDTQISLPLEQESDQIKAFKTELETLRSWTRDSKSDHLPSIICPTLDILLQLEVLVPLISPKNHLLKGHITDWLTKAFAHHESLEGCIRVNQSLSRDSGFWPELRFIAHERLVDLALFTKDYHEARLQVEALENLELNLHSPLFEARYLMAKSKVLGALDQSKGQSILEQAQLLSERFGITKPKS